MPRRGPPLFVCHANCCRSVMAAYLYRHLTGEEALSAGVEVGEEVNDRAVAMLSCWGIDARDHLPRRVDRRLCDEAGAILAMGPRYLARILARFGRDLAARSFLFADPFVLPATLEDDAFLVYDPSFEVRPAVALIRDFEWFRRRIVEIHQSLASGQPPLVPASRYRGLLDALAEA